MEAWLERAYKRIDSMPDEAKEVRERALADLPYFAQLVNPGHMYGSIHLEIFRWMMDYSLFGMSSDLPSNKLIMLPRAHLKSHMVATWASWIVAKHPEVTILYVSATAELAETQLYAIKNILAGEVFQRFFPEYLNPQEGQRERWAVGKISVDHPQRTKEGVRDATITTAGLTTNTTGWHADIIIPDDLVVPENAYTEEGRKSVSRKASQFTSIRNAGGFTLACGTRYHPSDVYYTWQEQVYDVFDNEGDLVGRENVWNVKEYAVEEDGVFLWPRRVREDGKAFGFNKQTLARIKAEYSDFVQFFAQYYNNPNAPGSGRISKDSFQYLNPRHLKKIGSRWVYNGRKLNIYAAVDFAFSLSRKADYTAIVVVGVDFDSNYFVLEIDRFKTDKVVTYFEHIAELHSKYNFKKLRAEVTVAQKVLVNAIKDHVKEEGLTLKIEDYRPNRYHGNKEERIAATLEPLYSKQQVYHTEGGWTDKLEEELVHENPRTDDVKDALTSAIQISIAPKQSTVSKMSDYMKSGPQSKSRFGGALG